MPARPELVELVDAEAGVIPSHIGAVRVAAAAELRDLRPLGRALERPVLGPVDVVRGGVSTVTIGAAQVELAVNVAFEGHDRRLELVLELVVALQAAVLLPETNERGEERRGGDEAGKRLSHGHLIPQSLGTV